MSEENVQAFKRALEAANRRDLEEVLEVLDPDVEWHSRLPLAGGDETYRGREAVREFLLETWDLLAATYFDFPQVLDAGDEVVALGHFGGRGAASGVETRMPFAYVVEFKAGKAVRVRAYLDHKEALQAAGVSSRRQRPSWAG
jgi:ketosteroid isomerase-like protein